MIDFYLGYAVIQLPDLMFWMVDFIKDKHNPDFNSIQNKIVAKKNKTPKGFGTIWHNEQISKYQQKLSTSINDFDGELISISIGDKNIQMKHDDITDIF